MAITSLSSQEFAQAALKALRDTDNGPVFITDSGAPTHVLLSFRSYEDLRAQRGSIAVSLAMPGVEDIEFDAERYHIQLRKADLS